MHIQFAELPVFDQDRAKAFYVEKLGCEVAADVPMGGDWRWIEVGFTAARTNLHFVRREDEMPSEEPVLVLVESDVAAAVEALKAKGVIIVSEPQVAPYAPDRTVADFRDSEGNRMVISSK
jgi:predicted enzyme related to lactoylglutathione lyase